MPNTQSGFNPSYSTVKSIFLASGLQQQTSQMFDIVLQNQQCRFERLETVENINEVLPQGSVLVTDRQDIATFIVANNLQYVLIEFFDGSRWGGNITSVSYANNAATVSEENLVSINFTNLYYTYFSSNNLPELLGYKKPNVFLIDEFVKYLRTFTFGSNDEDGYQDSALNYFLYRPFIPYGEREEGPPDNAIEMINYIASGAIDKDKNPNFLFWTGFNGAVNFKSFKRDLTKDPSYETIDTDYRNIAIFDGDAVLQKLSDGKVYRKAYFLATNPAYQWISKNYYYIRKTPKYLDALQGLTAPTAEDLYALQQKESLKNLTFQFQDDGQKYNIDVVSTLGRGTTAPKGGDQIYPAHSWGYYDGDIPTNNKSITNMIGNQYGTNASYKKLNLMGLTGFMPFLDSPDMWKNMFDLTPIHPHYPDETNIPPGQTLAGKDTRLQTVMNIRYNTFMGLCGANPNLQGACAALADKRLEEIRAIEAQNFVLYSLCCMGKQEDCFFAALTGFAVDSEASQEGPNGSKVYRYKWNKINFSSGVTSGCGVSCDGGTYSAHQLENWCLDETVKSSDVQDDTWAINLNERGLTGNYLPPGWVSTNLPTGFKFRPVGLPSTTTTVPTSGDISHIVRLCRERIDANNVITYFWAENVVDGTC